MTAREYIQETERYLDDLDRMGVLWSDPDDEPDPEDEALWVQMLEEDES